MKTVNDEEFVKRTGSPLTSIGIKNRQADAVLMNCDPSRSNLQQTFFLELPGGKLLLLWDGVFLELKSPHGGWGASLLKLITN